MLEVALVLAMAGVAALLAGALTRWLLGREWGTARVREVADLLEAESVASLGRHRKTVGLAVVAVGGVLFAIYGFVRAHEAFDPARTPLELSVWATSAFALGAVSGLLTGHLHAWLAARTDLRVAAASGGPVREAAGIALRGGAIAGAAASGASLVAIAGMYAVYFGSKGVTAASGADLVARLPFAIAPYAFGASLATFFAQVGADLDERTRGAVRAGASLFESAAVEAAGATLVTASVCFWNNAKLSSHAEVVGVLLFPLVIRGLGLVASLAGTVGARPEAGERPAVALRRGLYVSSVLLTFGLLGASYGLLGTHWLPLFACGLVGVTLSVVLSRPRERSHVADVAFVLSGLLRPALLAAGAIVLSFELGEHAGLTRGGPLGIVLAASAALATGPYVLAARGIGPTADRVSQLFVQAGVAGEDVDRGLQTSGARAALGDDVAVVTGALAASTLYFAYVAEVDAYRCSAWADQSALPTRAFGALLAQCRSSLGTIESGTSASLALLGGAVAGVALVVGFLGVSARDPEDARSHRDRRTIQHAVVAAATPVAVGVFFKHVIGAGAEAVAALLTTTVVLGAAFGLFFAGREAAGIKTSFPTYLPVTGVIAFALVMAPLFV